jgi:glycine/sarcosine N-methyltransferase
MDFYQMLSKYYDTVFSDIQEEVDFLLSRLEKKDEKILDVACGTGQYSIALSDKGFIDIDAIDLDRSMIAQAEKKTDKIDFITGDMQKLKEYYTGFYDLVFCIGNSISHLNSPGDAGAFISDCRSLLAPGGRLIVQIINYDRIYAKTITSLPLIVKDDIVFERNYTLKEDKVIFSGILKIDDNKFEGSIELLALKHDELISLFENSGFRKIEKHGGFNSSPYDPATSYALVIEAINTG